MMVSRFPSFLPGSLWEEGPHGQTSRCRRSLCLALVGLVLPLLVVSGASAAAVGPSSVASEGGCVPGPETLCLSQGRFAVQVDWQDAEANAGAGQVIPIAGGEAGYFTYDEPDYLELQVQVIDGCSSNGHRWVLTAGLSDDAQVLTVTDTVEGTQAIYMNPLGEYGLTMFDTAAIPCGQSAQETRDSATSSYPPSSTSQTLTSQTLLGSTDTTLKLVDGRFEVEVDWVDFQQNSGSGHAIEVTEASGSLWFFNPASPDLAVKVYDGSSINGSFWVVYGGPINVEFDLRVTDVCSGITQNYNNPIGVLAETVADTAAFAATPTCVLHRDGFESGNTSDWSATSP